MYKLSSLRTRSINKGTKQLIKKRLSKKSPNYAN